MKNFKKIVVNCLFNFFVCASLASSFVVAQEVSSTKKSKTVTWAEKSVSHTSSNGYGLRPRTALVEPRKTLKKSSVKTSCTNSSSEPMAIEEHAVMDSEQNTQEALRLAAIREKQAKKRSQRLADRSLIANAYHSEQELLNMLGCLTSISSSSATSVAVIDHGISRLTISSTSVTTHESDDAELDAEAVALLCQKLKG